MIDNKMIYKRNIIMSVILFQIHDYSQTYHLIHSATDPNLSKITTKCNILAQTPVSNQNLVSK